MDTFTVEYTPSAPSGGYAPMPAGSQVVVCVDGIYLGQKVEAFQSNPPRLVQKYALVFQSEQLNPDTRRPYEISKEFTLSIHEDSALRKFLAAWRGKAYTDEEARKIDLHKVEGACGIATVEHKVSSGGRTYAVITNISPLLRWMDPITADHYSRAPYWEKRKAEYLADVEAFHRLQAREDAAKAAAAQAVTPDGRPVALADDPEDGLPF